MARKQTTGKTTTKKKTAAKKTAKTNPAPPPPKRNKGEELPEMPDAYGSNIIGGVLFLILAVCSVISYFNTEGSLVEFFSNWLRGLLGWGFYLAAPAFAVSAVLLFTAGDRPVGARVFATVMLPVILAALSELMLNTGIRDGSTLSEAVEDLYQLGMVMKSGGVIGGLIAFGMNRLLSVAGALPLLVLGFLYCFVVCCWGSLRGLIARITRSHNAYVRYEQQQSELRKKAPAAEKTGVSPKRPTKIVQGDRRSTYGVDIPLGEEEDLYNLDEAADLLNAGAVKGKTPVRKSRTKIIHETAQEEDEVQLQPPATVSSRKAEADAVAAQVSVGRKRNTEQEASVSGRHLSDGTSSAAARGGNTAAALSGGSIIGGYSEEAAAASASARAAASASALAASAAASVGPAAEPDVEEAASAAPVRKAGQATRKVRPSRSEAATPDEVRREREKMEQAIADAPAADDYVFPPLSLLRASTAAAADATDEVNLNRVRLEEAIQSFGISASVVGVIRGPTVTRYDIELDRGVKLARITNLAGDLALSLGVVNVRIAPIPDKISTVGIEVPNRTVSTVFLRDILDSGNFSGAKSKLSFALGKDIGGNCIVGNISKLPHLLIAGTTGSGKSVCMNSLILSLLYKARPDEVKLIMIDPKMVELGIYNGIPHLYVPVVTDPKKAAGALQWSVVEMLKRYRAFSELGVRDLDNYNRIMKEQQSETLPRVVIVIDELADLMLVASKDVEESICRVAQMGRAAGMHLVIATQRPSADVITGLMKANIPSRIAFAVSSALESRIILDQGGAEKLIGFGDMLYSPIGAGKPTRIQGSYVSDEEREDVINFIKENNGASANTGSTGSEIEDFMLKATKEKGKGGSEEKEAASDGPVGDYDEMLPQAVEVVIEMGSCSVSMLQRRLKLGYSRAARIVDQMEELGVVGPYEGAKPRSVTVDNAGWQSLQVKLGFVSADTLPADAGLDAGYDDPDENDDSVF